MFVSYKRQMMIRRRLKLNTEPGLVHNEVREKLKIVFIDGVAGAGCFWPRPQLERLAGHVDFIAVDVDGEILLAPLDAGQVHLNRVDILGGAVVDMADEERVNGRLA